MTEEDIISRLNQISGVGNQFGLDAFSKVGMDAIREIQALRKQNIELLAVIEQAKGHLNELESILGYIPILDKARQALSPSSEALEARDRVRDAKLLRYVTKGNDHMQMRYIRKLAAARESGTWTPGEL